MKTLSCLSALLLAGTLAACGNGKDEPSLPPAENSSANSSGPEWQASIANLQALAGEAFSLEDQLEADLQPINDALPELLSVSWDDKSLDAATGATVFSGLKVTIATDPEFGILAEEAAVWGLDTDLVAARLRGERLAETGLAFSRLEARNVSYFGVANAFNTLFDAMAESMEEEAGTGLDFGFDRFESSTAEMVFSNVSLRPYELVPASGTFFEDNWPQDEPLSQEDAEQQAAVLSAIRLAQHVIAVSRSLSIEAVAAHDTTTSYLMNQPGMTQSAEVSLEFYGYEDLNGLDLGRAVGVNAVQSHTMEFANDGGELDELDLDGIEFGQVETTAFMSYADLKLDKLAGFLVRSEFPSMDERDLLSLGTWEARDYTLKFNDGDVFEADRVAFEADDFAWFFPEDVTFGVSGAKIGAKEAGEVVLAFIPESAAGPAAEDGAVPEAQEEDGETAEEGAAPDDFKQNLRAAIGKLEEHGLATIPFDVSMRWQWGADSGETGFSLDSSSEGFGTGAISFDVDLPAYPAIREAFDAEDREIAFEEAFKAAFAFRGARFHESDDGGYDKLFAYASAIGKLYPQEGWGAMLGGMEPQQMRNFIATMIRSGKQAASQEFPPAAAWLESVASYYESPGGSIEIKAAPPRPLTLADFEALGPDADPEQIVEEFGFSVTQTGE